MGLSNVPELLRMLTDRLALHFLCIFICLSPITFTSGNDENEDAPDLDQPFEDGDEGAINKRPFQVFGNWGSRRRFFNFPYGFKDQKAKRPFRVFGKLRRPVVKRPFNLWSWRSRSRQPTTHKSLKDMYRKYGLISKRPMSS